MAPKPGLPRTPPLRRQFRHAVSEEPARLTRCATTTVNRPAGRRNLGPLSQLQVSGKVLMKNGGIMTSPATRRSRSAGILAGIPLSGLDVDGTHSHRRSDKEPSSG
jgi:hypothetical protein